MSGIYTELAKRRAEQSKEPVSHGSPPPPSEKPVVHVPQGKKDVPASLQTRAPAKVSPTLSDSEKVEKYTTHLEPSLVKKIKLAAIEKEYVISAAPMKELARDQWGFRRAEEGI
jgi:hypothetical protein